MIHDKLESIKNYKGINKYLDEAIDFASKADFININDGLNVINDHITITKLVGLGKNPGESKGELHRCHYDLQVVLSGQEISYFGSYNADAENHIAKEYNKEKDVIKYDVELDNKVIMNNKNFTIFFPSDIHMPSQKIDDNVITKLVIKVLID